MTLTEVIKNLGDCAAAEPNINTVLYNNIYQLNTTGDVDFSAICITQDKHTFGEDIDTFGFFVFYVDRLSEDESNLCEIQSTGCLMLKNIFNRFNNIDSSTQIEYSYNVTPYTERFTSNCAGVYATISITTDSIGICEI